MTTTTLPQLSELALSVATPAQKDVIIQREHRLWSRGKDIESYRKETAEVDAGPWSANRQQIQWVLVKRNDLEGEVFSSCETHRRMAFSKAANSEEVKPAHLYSIASVVTADEHQKRGYASHMLRLLHLRLSPPESYDALPEPFNVKPPALAENVEAAILPATASALWSDVGSTFYGKMKIPAPSGIERSGWDVPSGLGDTAVRWKPKEDLQLKDGEQKWTWIYYNELEEVGKELSADVKAELKARPVDSTKGVVTFDYSSPGLLQFLPERARHKDRLSAPYTDPIGARIPRKNGRDSIILFAPRFFIDTELALSLVHKVNEEELDQVLPALATALKQSGCEDVVTWGLNDGLARAFIAHGGEKEKRKEIGGHLLGVVVYAEGEWDVQDGQAVTWC